jgi:hypothetical protein
MTSGDDQREQDRPRDHRDPDGSPPRPPPPPPPHPPHLTPDLPPAAEAPELPGAVRPHPEDSEVGRQAELPPPYGPLGRRGTGRKGA